MSDAATLTVSSGPDRGRVFRLDDELVHIGSGTDNHVALRDTLLPEHTASVVQKNGRFAIYTPLDQAVQIDGSPIPADCWVWLPQGARIRLSERTSLQFAQAMNGSSNNGSAAESTTPPAATRKTAQVPTFLGLDSNGADAAAPVFVSPSQAASRRGTASKAAAKRPEKKGGNVARFITDQPGDPLVRLGEDGHLPELALVETASRKGAEKKNSGSSPALLYVILGVSMLLSVALLLVDSGSFGSTEAEKRAARDEITSYYGGPEAALEPYQRILREARLAQARGDRTAERDAYRRVIALLNSENKSRLTGLTGSQQRDERLRELIGILLSE